jgi:hypothetical protein
VSRILEIIYRGQNHGCDENHWGFRSGQMASQLQCVGCFVDFEDCVGTKGKIPIEMGAPK